MLISSKDILKKAQQSGYGVPGFNFYNQDVVESIVETAEALSSPVILMITPIYIENLGLESAAFMARCVAEAARVPVALHLDHGHTYEQAQRCLEAGFTSVMIDGSELPLQENIQLTQKVVALAQKYGASVEAELGAVGGAEDMAQEGAQQRHGLNAAHKAGGRCQPRQLGQVQEYKRQHHHAVENALDDDRRQ